MYKRSELRFPVLVLALFAAFAVLYMYNIGGYLTDDDEGTDLYQAWQLQKGRRPGIDFMSEQQPLYMLLGSALIGWFGRTVLPLRLLSAVHVLGGALGLGIVVRRWWDDTTAAITVGVTLSSGLVYQQARVYRADAMMLSWEMLGLAVLLVTIRKPRNGLWALAGALYGIAALMKPFGVLPVVGVGLYALSWLWRERTQWRKVVVGVLCFGLAFLLVWLGASAVMYGRYGFYYREAFEQQYSLGRQEEPLRRLLNLPTGCVEFVIQNLVFLFIVPLWLLNKPKGWLHQSEMRLLVAQVMSPLVFLAMTRPFYARYLLYLVPVLALMLGRQISLAFAKIGQDWPAARHYATLGVLVFTGFAAATTLPSMPPLLLGRESDTLALAAYVAEHTQSDDKVLGDYPGINFLANRDSIYEAAIVNAAQIKGQIVTSDLLIDRIESGHVEMVLLHVAGGHPLPHHLIDLADFDRFRQYLNDRFHLLTVFDRAGQQIEIYRHG